MFRQPQFILDMTANHKTYGGMRLSFLYCNLLSAKLGILKANKQEMKSKWDCLIAQMVVAHDC